MEQKDCFWRQGRRQGLWVPLLEPVKEALSADATEEEIRDMDKALTRIRWG